MFEWITDLIKLVFSQAHPWFKCIQWDMLYEMEAAYRPTVIGDLDTQNFEKFPEVSMLSRCFDTYSLVV